MVHGIVAIKQWNPRWLVVFYCLLVLIDEVKLLVVMCALIDSSVNIRARIEASSNKQ
jgi:hypothetical protein